MEFDHEDMHRQMLDDQYWEPDEGDGSSYDWEPPQLPDADGTYTLGGAGHLQYVWVPAEQTTGYWAAYTQGEYDIEAEYGNMSFFVGKWTDPETNTVHIDGTCWFDDLREAEGFGRMHDQIAIWDIAAGKEIRL